MKQAAVVLTLLGSLFCTVSAPALAELGGSSHWVFRSSLAHVSPHDSSGHVLDGDGVAVGSATALGLNVAYMFDQHWGIELLAASPFKHDLTGTGALAGLDIGTTKQLPPTLSVLYQWGDEIKYHAGIGVNHTIFFEDRSSDKLTEALGATSTDLDLSNSTNLSLKFGIDVPLTQNWNFNANVYYMNIDTTADVIVNGAVAASVDVDINPLIYLVGFSMSY